MTTKIERRIKIKYRVRNKISGTPERPRMSVFRSNKQIYVQVIDDLSGKTLVDGAFANAVPGDVAKKLGADFVVGISLSPAKDYEKTFFLTRSGEKKEICQRGIGRCDFLLAPDLSAYSAASVTGAAEMYDIGYECAMRACDDLMRALRAKKISV